MYYSDQIDLLAITYAQDDIGQDIPAETARTVFCDLQSVSGEESTLAGQQNIHASGRAIVHQEDYSHEEMARIGNDTILKPGEYTVYRTYYNKGNVELYLTEKVATNGKTG